MPEPQLVPFTTRAQCQGLFRDCLGLAGTRLQMFDPDFAIFPLGDSAIDTVLRRFLAQGGTLQLAMHQPQHIERHYPRFLRLLRDYAHRMECRVTGAHLKQLTDSFCIADGVHVVRRFHSDHFRGEAAFDAPQAAEVPLERFGAIWTESAVALHATTTGL